VVRTTLERPDDVTASAVSAREQISKAVADKIRELETGDDLKQVAEDVIPQFEKFLESPEEKRLRRIRTGVIISAAGLGATIISFIIALDKSDVLPFVGLGLTAFLVGLGIILNGLIFTIPRKQLPGERADALSQMMLDSNLQNDLSQQRVMTNELSTSSKSALPTVTEHTTQHLQSKQR
jgi:hypothetical protein